ncbi:MULTISPECIES: DNA-3-methyladenine glycosylase I [Leuconostoc]|uniref:DNA-3-methyladenine glycosylase I n=2 Tax=Leuconostoc kimchii TaxID=136609 RepID=D5T3Q4_LEUKI|nr:MULTISPECIES: DNA-3-methyladenine glycosylase I [Leuconostoc]ADG40903.1 DNA-3-methyladenine glycosylase I [Leuconostoc kimchii IMSNU 11154]AEJ31123.1 DNA-3-methyladenine glycosylase I [Leuconostoc sp. C2]QBR48212.1 DNA-3-methyladenine glycosylase I [Leuconostoc kimchii]
MAVTNVKRCQWVSKYRETDIMVAYHDQEWGHPLRDDDRLLFELLTLEIFQAGLSWEISLKKRPGLKSVFYDFNIEKVSHMGESEVQKLKENPNIIRNRMKISATITNANAIQNVKNEFGSFSKYMWHFTDNRVIDHHVVAYQDVVNQNELSQTISKDMKKRGFKFTGPVTIYSYLQAMGVINDHEMTCNWKYHD